MDKTAKEALAQLLVRDDTLSELAALKQDARDFGWRQRVQERDQRAQRGPLYRIAKTLLPKLAISQQNLRYYASLANFYTVYDLRRLKAEQTHLYLLCSAWLRYRQLTDNLVDALGYHMKQLEDESKTRARQHFAAEQVRRQQETPQVGRLLLLYVDDAVGDATPFGDVRQRAYQIMSKDALLSTGQRLSVKPPSKLAGRWQAVDGLAERLRRHLRPLYGALDFAGIDPDNPWLAALAWTKGVFAKPQRLSQRPLAECPKATLPERLRPYLLVFDADGKPTGVQADRYEFWLYRQIRKRLKSGEIYLDDSVQHRCFTDELVSLDEQTDVLGQLDIPWLRQPIEAQLDALTTELHGQWLAFNRELRQGKLTHLDYDSKTRTLTWRRPKAAPDAEYQDRFYEQVSFCDVADVFRFANEQCQFLSALTPLQPRYAKQVADADSRSEPDATGDLRVRQADPQPLHPALSARPATATQRPPLAEPDRVLPPATLRHRPGRRQEGAHRPDRHRNRDQQPMCAADCEHHRLLQFRHPVAAAGELRSEPESKNPSADQEAVAGSLAAHSLERSLYLSWQRSGYRFGCDRGGVGIGIIRKGGIIRRSARLGGIFGGLGLHPRIGEIQDIDHFGDDRQIANQGQPVALQKTHRRIVIAVGAVEQRDERPTINDDASHRAARERSACAADCDPARRWRGAQRVAVPACTDRTTRYHARVSREWPGG